MTDLCWMSYFPPVGQEEVKRRLPFAPQELVDLYAVGDAPFVDETDDGAPAYSIQGIENATGHALNFLGVTEEPADNILAFASRFGSLIDRGYFPVATDAGSELLCLKISDRSVWHYAPSMRLSTEVDIFKISRNFSDFVHSISIIPYEF